MKRLLAMAVALAAVAVACKQTTPPATRTVFVTVTASPSVGASASPEKPKKPEVVIRGAYQGRCVVESKSQNISGEIPQVVRWTIRPQGKNLVLTSKTGGYTMTLRPRGRERWYGSAKVAAWQYAFTLTASQGGNKVTVHSHDTFIGGGGYVRLTCKATRA